MWRWALLVLVAVGALGVLMRDPLLQAAGDFLILSDPAERVDAVIAIGGDGIERITTARRLLQNGYGQWLIVSGGPYGPGLNSAFILRDQAQGAGVPPERILIDDRAESTVDNAEGAARLMTARGLRSGVVLTSPYHTRRAAVVFSRIFSRMGLRVRVLAVDDGYFSVHRWWTRAFERRLVVREYGKLVAFLGGIR
jgi:uncharacterized SAM-binding protein YcdF (DUF218 family)